MDYCAKAEKKFCEEIRKEYIHRILSYPIYPAAHGAKTTSYRRQYDAIDVDTLFV